MLLKTKYIFSICFDLNDPHDFFSIYRKSICGSIKNSDIITMNYHYKFTIRTPDDLCMRITVAELPTSDQLLQDKFYLRIIFIAVGNNSKKDHEFVISKTYQSFILTSDTSLSEITLQIIQVSQLSKFFISFEVTECNLAISIYMPTYDFNTGEVKLLSINKPSIYYPVHEITEYHTMIRTKIGTTIKIIALCLTDSTEFLANHLVIHDGPSEWAPIRHMGCSEDRLELVVTTFQMYIVFRSYQNVNTLFAYYYDEFKKIEAVHVDGIYGFSFYWEYGNYSEVVYYVFYLEADSEFQQISYKLDISPTIGQQGHMCQ